jgi:hypothetical protein
MSRPTKTKAEKRDKRLTVKLTTAEVTEIAAAARATGGKPAVSDYIRERIFGAPVKAAKKSAPGTGAAPRTGDEATDASIRRLIETLSEKQTGVDALAAIHEQLAAMTAVLASLAAAQAEIIENQRQAKRKY